MHRGGPGHQASVSEIQLWQRHLYPVWRQLPERVRWLAILLAGETQLRCIGYRPGSKMLGIEKFVTRMPVAQFVLFALTLLTTAACASDSGSPTILPDAPSAVLALRPIVP